MARAGWSNLIPRENCFQGSTAFRIDAYSEYMPPPRVGWKPYGPVPVNPYLFSPDDPFGWKVHEFDEALELQPGLHQIAKDLMTRLKRLQEGNPDTGLPRHISRDNPFWPPELESANLQNDPCVLLLPLSLSRTQDDTGRVRWTLFCNSEQGPGKAFWKSALKLWMSWKHLGPEGLGALVEHNDDLAGYLTDRVRESPDLDLAVEPPLSVVCFRHVPPGHEDWAPERLDAYQTLLQRALEIDGTAWVSVTSLRSRTYLRAGIVNYLSTEAEVDAMLAALRRLSEGVLEQLDAG